MNIQIKIQTRTQLISIIEKFNIQISQYEIKKILEHMYHGQPVYLSPNGKIRYGLDL